MHSADVNFPAEVCCAQDSPSLMYFTYTVYVQIPSIKGGYSFVTRYAKKLEMKGSTLWPMFVAFFKAMFLQEQPKKTQGMQEPILQFYEVVPFESTYPKADSLKPYKPLVCPSFSMSSPLEKKITSGVSLYLECVPLYRKASATRCYKGQWVMNNWTILRDFYSRSQAWKKKRENTSGLLNLKQSSPLY